MNAETPKIRAASRDDLDDILALLRENDLPVAGVEPHLRNFIVARQDGKLAACAGAETYGKEALLRSLAVAGSARGTGLGKRMTREILDRLMFRGAREIYLLTTTAAEFFEKRGFERIPRAGLPEALAESEELKGACPESATSMRFSVA